MLTQLEELVGPPRQVSDTAGRKPGHDEARAPHRELGAVEIGLTPDDHRDIAVGLSHLETRGERLPAGALEMTGR